MGSVSDYQTSEGKRYRVRYRTPDRRQTDKRGFRTKRDALEFLATVEVSKLRGEWIDASRSKINVAEWAETWFEAQLQLKPTTLAGYRNALDKHVLPKWGQHPIGAVEHAEVQAWVNGLAKTRSASTVRQAHLALSGVLKLAVRDRRLTRNVCEDVRLPRLMKRTRGYLSHRQVSQLATQCEPVGDVVMFLAYTGLRWGELAALKVERVDLPRHRVEVVEAVTEPGGKLVWGSPKSHERRSVPFPSFLDSALARRIEGKGSADLLFDNSGLVF